MGVVVVVVGLLREDGIQWAIFMIGVSDLSSFCALTLLIRQ